MKRILLTGGNGFIASTFFEKYKDKYDIDLYEGFTSDSRPTWGEYSIDYDIILHLGAEAGVRRSHDAPELFWERNVVGTQKVIEIQDDQLKPCKLIYASSSSIYDWHMSPYATTKKVCEMMCEKLDAVGLRFHTVYGPNSRKDMFFDALLNDKIKYVTDHTRDWTHVDDVCTAIDIIIEKGRHLRGAIDVGTGFPVSVADMVKHFGKGPFPVKKVTGEREHTHARPVELLDLGWTPAHHILTEKLKDYV
jgi:nucleoside-diphosphate-sugar epimerase